MPKNVGYELADGSWSSDYKIKDKFVVVEDDNGCFSDGAVVEFRRDDESDSPSFGLVDGNIYSSNSVYDESFYPWYNLIPYKLTQEQAKENVAKAKKALEDAERELGELL